MCIEMKSLLFVGGPADGKRMSVPATAMRWMVADTSRLDGMNRVKMNEGDTAFKLDVLSVDYGRKRIAICDGGEDFEIMADSRLSFREVLEMLANGYRIG
jgi:hypothetical protein